MEDQIWLEVIKGGISLANTTIGAIVGALLTTIFLRKNTKTTEFEKIKNAKFTEVTEDLLKDGKMSYLEFYKCNNFLKVAKKADELHKASDRTSESSIEKAPYDFDWFVRFYEYTSCVSNEEMQSIWASVMAREVDNPGSFSLSLLNSLSLMTKDEALLFCNISRFALRDVDYSPLPLLFVSTNRKAYEGSGITPERLKQLQRLGLIDCDFNKEYIYVNKKVFKSGNKVITVYGDPKNDNKILAGNVVFTSDGVALYSIVDDDYKRYRSDILDFTVEKFKHRNCRVFINDKEV